MIREIWVPREIFQLRGFATWERFLPNTLQRAFFPFAACAFSGGLEYGTVTSLKGNSVAEEEKECRSRDRQPFTLVAEVVELG